MKNKRVENKRNNKLQKEKLKVDTVINIEADLKEITNDLVEYLKAKDKSFPGKLVENQEVFISWLSKCSIKKCERLRAMSLNYGTSLLHCLTIIYSKHIYGIGAI